MRGALFVGSRTGPPGPSVLDQRGEQVETLWSHEDIHVWVLSEEGVAPALSQTSGHDHHSVGFLALQSSGRAQVAQQPRVGLLADGAGVVHEELPLLRLGHREVAHPLEDPGDAFRVVLVHLAAEGAQVVGVLR